jgi:hypothetical protein
LNTGLSGDLPPAENVLFGGRDAGKPCIFMGAIVRGNTSTAFLGGFRRAGLCRRKRRGLIVCGNMSTGTISCKKRQIICYCLILFSRKYTMLLPAAALKRGFPVAGYMQNRAFANTGHEGGMGGDAHDISGDA